jgi:hypothetical protein
MVKPQTLKSNLAHLPVALAPLVALDHWLLWRWELRKGIWTKPPYIAASPTARAKNNDPTTWRPYKVAVAAVQNGAGFDGLGFALLDTPFDVVDLDHCLDPATGQPDTWALIWLKEANGAYVERTPSGEGLRIIGKTSTGEKLHRKWLIKDAREKAAIEVYRTCERYVTVTGIQVGDCKELVHVDLLEKIKAHYERARSSGGGFDFNSAGASIDYDEIIRNGGPAGADASALFHGAVGHLSAKGMSIDEIVEELSKWPNGIGRRYAGRLRQEVERSFEKWETKRRIKPEEDEAEPDEEGKWDSVNKKGIPNPTRTNARRALRALGIKCRYDEFHDKLLVEGVFFKQLTNLDHTALMLCAKIHKAYKFDPGPKRTLDGIIQLCMENKFDPVLDYLNSLRWDGRPRLDRWLIDYLGAVDSELNREFGRIALIAAVRRVRRPGTKFDPIVVLEGPMGTQKSKAIETMAGIENFSDQTILGARDREQQELLAGVWLFEIAELSNIRKAEVEHIKAFASRTHDRARPAYGRTRIDQPRRCVLFATTNDDQYLKIADRRFWPVRTTAINIEALKRDRDQLWAEAAQQEAEGASIVLNRNLWGSAYIEQTAREEHDPWDDILSGVAGTVEQGEERVFSRDLLKTVLEFQTSRLLDRDSKRLSRCMRRLGWDGPKVVRIGQERTSGYSRTKET